MLFTLTTHHKIPGKTLHDFHKNIKPHIRQLFSTANKKIFLKQHVSILE